MTDSTSSQQHDSHSDLLWLVESNHLCRHLYADDMQINAVCHLIGIAWLQQQMSACIDDVVMWMRSSQSTAAQHGQDRGHLVLVESMFDRIKYLRSH